MRLFWLILLLSLHKLSDAISIEEYRHLLSRTGFDPRPSEFIGCNGLSYDQVVKNIIDHTHTQAVTPPPAWVDEPPPDRAELNMSEEQRKAFRMQIQMTQREQGQQLKAWWYREMLVTDSPLTERMTLFWSNHFTSSLEKVHSPALLYRQNVLLRREALGNFATMLHEIAKDPAMVVYLDSINNRLRAPNENFARELLELFTLGEGHYSEQDIKEAARAFTGYSLDRQAGIFRFYPRMHDYGEKSFMGRRGNFNGDDIIDILLQNPQTSKHIVEKLWHEFISPTPDPVELERFSKLFREQKFEIKPLLQAMLSSQAFRDPAQRGILIKSPVELMIGTFRTFELDVEDTRPLLGFGIQMGQDLFNPPNVKGWAGGETWIDANRLLVRRQFSERALRGQEQPDKQWTTGIDNGQLRQRIAELKGQGFSREQIKARLRQEVSTGKFPLNVVNGSGKQNGDNMQRLDQNTTNQRMAFAMVTRQYPALHQQVKQWRAQGLTHQEIREKVHQYIMTNMAPDDQRKIAQQLLAGNNINGRRDRLIEMAKMLPMPPANPEQWMNEVVQLASQEPPQAPAQIAEHVMLAISPTQAVPQANDANDLLMNLMLDPVYQLK